MLKLVNTQTIKSVGDVAKCSEKFNVLRLSFVPTLEPTSVAFYKLRFVLDSSFYCGDLRPYVAIQQYLLWDRARLASFKSARCLFNGFDEVVGNRGLSTIYLYFPEMKDVELRFLQNFDSQLFTLNCEFIYDDNFHLFDNIDSISNQSSIIEGPQNFELSPKSFYYLVDSFPGGSDSRIDVTNLTNVVVDGISFLCTALVYEWFLSTSNDMFIDFTRMDSYLIPIPKGSRTMFVPAKKYHPYVDLFKLNLK